MSKRLIKSYAVVILVVLIIVSVIAVTLNKPPIEQATIYEIQAIQGIGEILSLRIVNYIGDSETFDIEDLLNVKGIGKEKLKELRKEFRWLK